MGINVAIFDHHMAAGDDGYLFEFTDNDPDLGKFVTDWTNTPSFSHMEIWRDAEQL